MFFLGIAYLQESGQRIQINCAADERFFMVEIGYRGAAPVGRGCNRE
jgi:hypothetical protein